ncbi:uncharacterized protein LOC109135743 [Beta vulgaris subsp. vulgaris]|uniref:uncharacterized protein LOC109135743 n=1 Tax=Beta vulgaris subsp. vulgaris TaxID=3555 RepID=UPI000901742D|nr:uncharacterized protein LOC109135743 [Beta vulgaris subsp. vulgaris]
MYLSTATEIWQDLEERFSQISGPQFYSLQQNLSEISQGSSSIIDYFTQIKGIWDELSAIRPLPTCTCNGCKCNLTQKFMEQQDEDKLIQMLMKLDNQYANARSNILMMQPLPKLSLAYRLLLVQDEKQRQTSSNPSAGQVYAYNVSESTRDQSGESTSTS